MRGTVLYDPGDLRCEEARSSKRNCDDYGSVFARPSKPREGAARWRVEMPNSTIVRARQDRASIWRNKPVSVEAGTRPERC